MGIYIKLSYDYDNDYEEMSMETNGLLICAYIPASTCWYAAMEYLTSHVRRSYGETKVSDDITSVLATKT